MSRVSIWEISDVKVYNSIRAKLSASRIFKFSHKSAFSGGKDSAVLLDLVKKALPKDSFVVIFGDTGMEFPDTYDVVKKTQEQCEKDGTHFYIAKSHFNPEESWKIFGPPARVLRWCCTKTQKYNLSERDIFLISTASALHDVGKFAVKEEIVNKPAKLTDAEFEEMKKHTIYGAQVISGAKNFRNRRLMEYACG